jgi:hypothetical protein
MKPRVTETLDAYVSYTYVGVGPHGTNPIKHENTFFGFLALKTLKHIYYLKQHPNFTI